MSIINKCIEGLVYYFKIMNKPVSIIPIHAVSAMQLHNYELQLHNGLVFSLSYSVPFLFRQESNDGVGSWLFSWRLESGKTRPYTKCCRRSTDTKLSCEAQIPQLKQRVQKINHYTYIYSWGKRVAHGTVLSHLLTYLFIIIRKYQSF